jgi:hypothetical protein
MRVGLRGHPGLAHFREPAWSMTGLYSLQRSRQGCGCAIGVVSFTPASRQLHLGDSRTGVHGAEVRIGDHLSVCLPPVNGVVVFRTSDRAQGDQGVRRSLLQ